MREFLQFRVLDPISGASFNDDGTSSQNPVIHAGSLNLGGVSYLLKTLNSQKTIRFNGSDYTVYSVISQDMTINWAYNHASDYYSLAAITDHDSITPLIDFPVPIPNKINTGLATALKANQPPNAPLGDDRGATEEDVYLTVPPADASSRYFIPNLPNTPGQHNGLTANIYFVVDPFIGKPGYWPSTDSPPFGSYHLTPYGWAMDPRTVGQNYYVNLLNKSGGTTYFEAVSLYEPTPILRNTYFVNWVTRNPAKKFLVVLTSSHDITPATWLLLD
jgi:hypothetical protein